jgi:uncharacterized protein with LGFP repeats
MKNIKQKFIVLFLFIVNAATAQKIIFSSSTNPNNPPDVQGGERIIQKLKKLNIQTQSLTLVSEMDVTELSFVYSAVVNNTVSMFYVKPPYKKGAQYKDEAFAMWGAIRDEFFGLELRNKGKIIGYPITDEFKTPNKSGAGQHFNAGSIYWSAATGANEIHGAIRDKWAALGWENSWLGFPKTAEILTSDGFGRYNNFEGGSIYFHPHLGTYAIPNMIKTVWEKEGKERGKLGYPLSDEIIKNNNSVQLFEFGAVISTKAGAYKTIFNSLRGSNGLYTKWKETGGVNSYLGDLVTANKNYPKMYKYHFAEFEKGYIYEDGTKAFVIKKGPIFNYYASQGWEAGRLGLPIEDEKTTADGTIYQGFQNGTVYYTKALGAFERKL